MTTETKKLKKTKRTRKQIFLDKLKALSQGEQRLITNASLREQLGWDENVYRKVKGDLVSEREIIVGTGYSGKVGLAAAPGETSQRSLQLFISYSHTDEDIKDELIKHLSPLKRLNLIEAWHDRKINAGDKWETAIGSALQNADIILLLVSIDFINSKYCYDIEMETALELERSGKAVVIPVIVRNCMWQATEFSRLQATPTDGRAIASWSDRDEAITIVVKKIREVAERLMAER